MPLRGSGGDENGRLTLDARITSCPAWAIFKGRSYGVLLMGGCEERTCSSLPRLLGYDVRKSYTAPARIGEIRFNVHGCGLPVATRTSTDAAATPSPSELAVLLEGQGAHHRKYRRAKARVVRTWRTRADPFASIWDEVRLRLEAAPERTAKAIFLDLQQQYPGQYTAGQLRTLQRRVKDWRAHAILQFDQRWLEEELLPAQVL